MASLRISVYVLKVPLGRVRMQSSLVGVVVLEVCTKASLGVVLCYLVQGV
jgi:hypothetical protein